MIPAVLLQINGARAERLRSMGRHFQQTDNDVYFSVGVSVLAILAIFVVMKLVDYVQKRRDCTQIKAQPMSLFLRVQGQMGFSLLDRWRLWRLAKLAGVGNPTALLISPVLFDRAVDSYSRGIMGSGQSVRFAAIRKRLFGSPEPLPVDPVASPD